MMLALENEITSAFLLSEVVCQTCQFAKKKKTNKQTKPSNLKEHFHNIYIRIYISEYTSAKCVNLKALDMSGNARIAVIRCTRISISVTNNNNLYPKLTARNR